MKKLLVLTKYQSFLILLSLLVLNCGDKITSPITNEMPNLCYVKLINENWEVVLSGDNFQTRKNISNNPYTDDNPAWSPDGDNICYTHFNNSGSTDLIIYDKTKDSSYTVTSKTDYSASSPIWLNNRRIVYHYHKLGENFKTYVTDINGDNNRQILNFNAKIFFCNNQNDFFYKPEGTTDYNIIYKTNLDGNYNEVVLDMKTVGKEYTNVYDYDPIRGKLLLLIAQTERETNIIAEYDIATKSLDTLSTVENGYVYLQPQYSNDYVKVIAIARNYNLNISKILLLKDGNSSVLTSIEDDNAWFRFYDQVFAKNNKYIVYSKNIGVGGGSFYWNSNLYVFDLIRMENTYIDIGTNPVWDNK